MTADELKVVLAMFKALTAEPGTERIDARRNAIREAESLIVAKQGAREHRQLLRDAEAGFNG